MDALSVMEMTVGKITQSEDGQNKYEASNLKALENTALKEMILEPTTDDEKKKWKDILAKSKDKKIKLYFHVEVLDAEGDVFYKGDDVNDPKNFSFQKPFELTEGGTCFCGRDLRVDEFKNIIFQMRDSERIISKAVFTADNCTLKDSDKTYEKLTEVYNRVLKNYDINTCTRKIHFFAQTYWEADRFKTTLEYSNGEYLNPGKHKDAILNGHTVDGDGPRYKGRGLMQLTWRKKYKEYFEYIVKNNPSLVDNKTVEELLNRKGIYREIYFYNELNKLTNKKVTKSKVYMVDSASLVGSNIELAVDSAGWFWKEYKKLKGRNLNDFSDYGDKYIDKISTLVNGGSNRKTNRKTYYENLRDNVFKIKEKCINYKNIRKE